MGKPTPVRAKGARRLNATPELIANIRQRYEHSDEPLATMAADLGCSIETVRNMAQRAAAPALHDETPYDDMPADLDEFREALARRIEAFMESRGDEEDAFRVHGE